MAESPRHSTTIDDGDASKPTRDELINILDELLQPTTLPDNPCLTLFFQLALEDSILSHQQLTQILQQSWTQNSLTTLKIIFNSWGVEEKENFYASALWLHENHPKTLASNVESLVKFGYLEKVVGILCRIVQLSETFNQHVVIMRAKEKTKEKTDLILGATIEARNNLYMYDENYRILEDNILHLLFKLLESDLAYMRSGENKKITLTILVLYSELTATVLLSTRLAHYFFPPEEYKGTPEEYYPWVSKEIGVKVIGPLFEALGDPVEYMMEYMRARIELEGNSNKEPVDDGGMDPEFAMNAAISGKLYDELVVYD